MEVCSVIKFSAHNEIDGEDYFEEDKGIVPKRSIAPDFPRRAEAASGAARLTSANRVVIMLSGPAARATKARLHAVANAQGTGKNAILCQSSSISRVFPLNEHKEGSATHPPQRYPFILVLDLDATARCQYVWSMKTVVIPDMITMIPKTRPFVERKVVYDPWALPSSG